MPRQSSTGKCLLCNSVFSKSGMSKHLQSCMKNKFQGRKRLSNQQAGRGSLFHIFFEGYDLPDYWMHLAVSTTAKLEELDQFLRDIWVECCGHMSAFEIEGEQYSPSPMREYKEKGMNKKIGDLLSPGMKFSYDYDFGTTTRVIFKVMSGQDQEIQGELVHILARNEAPLIKCDNCDQIAKLVCSECIYSGGGWLCEKCAQEHECGEEMLLPVVNSPRVGMCGYTGDD